MFFSSSAQLWKRGSVISLFYKSCEMSHVLKTNRGFSVKRLTEVWRKEKLVGKGGRQKYGEKKVVEKRRKSRLWPPLQCHTRTPSVDWTCHTPPPDRDDDEVQYYKDDHGDDIDGSSHNLEGKSVLFAGRCWSWLLPRQGRDLGYIFNFQVLIFKS